MDAPCGICKGRLGPIHYEEPSDHLHPLSFVIDEIIPISKYKLCGYTSQREAAEDWNNLQAAHYICNSLKSNKINFSLEESKNKSRLKKRISVKDGEW